MGQLSIEGGQTSADILSDFATQGYSEVPHHIPRELIEELIDSYTVFTNTYPDPETSLFRDMIAEQLPRNPDGTYKKVLSKEESDAINLDALVRERDQTGTWHKYRSNYPEYAKPAGYTSRSLAVTALREVGIEYVDDPKEYYHFHPNSLVRMKREHAIHGWGPLPQELESLSQVFLRVQHIAKLAILQTLSALEEYDPRLVGQFGPDDFRSSPMRLLFYHDETRIPQCMLANGQSLALGDMFGGEHTDKGELTVQIAESHTGFRARNPHDPDATLRVIKRTPDRSIVFPSRGMDLAINGVDPNINEQPRDIRQLWHDIVHTGEQNIGRFVPEQAPAKRWALIYFLTKVGSKVATKAQTNR